VKDFAKKKPIKKTASVDIQRILLTILIGLIIATLITVAIKFTHNQSQDKPKPTLSKAPNPTFDFYSLLPKMSVHSTAIQSAMPPAIERNKKQADTTVKANMSYNLQIASFKNKKQAKALMARLIMLGMNSKVQTYTQNKVTWQRVIVGPFKDRLLAEKNQVILNNQHINSVITQSQ
jgi:cell division protein FtsN